MQMISRKDAADRRDVGIARAEDRANRDHIQWSEEAEAAVRLYCVQHPRKQFLTEDVRAWAESMGLVSQPENGRAWGAVIQRCARLGLIRRVGYAPAKSSNLSPKPLWEAV